MYYIYIIENLINGKSYIGQTANPDLRWKKHKKAGLDCPYLHRAIRKYGHKSFDFALIQSCATAEEINIQEAYWIDMLGTMSPIGYNLKKGGLGGGPDSPETREKKRLAKLGEKNPFYGYHHSEESKKRISMSKVGVPIRVPTEDKKRRRAHISALNKSRIGQTLSVEHKLNIAAGQLGKSHTEDTIKKMREARQKWWAERKQACQTNQSGL